MRNHLSKILAVLLLIGVAETLSACVVYEGHPYYHHHDWDDEDGWHHHHW